MAKKYAIAAIVGALSADSACAADVKTAIASMPATTRVGIT